MCPARAPAVRAPVTADAGYNLKSGGRHVSDRQCRLPVPPQWARLRLPVNFENFIARER